MSADRIRQVTTFDDDLLAAATSLADRARRHDAVAPFSDDLWREARAGRTSGVWRADAPDGRLVGLAYRAEQGARRAVELLVDPASRRQGHGGALVDAVLGDDDGEVWLWSHGDHPAARVLAQRHGLERARELLQLRRTLGPADSSLGADSTRGTEAPAGVTIRPFVVGQDEEAWLAVNNAAFAWHPEQGRLTLADIHAAESEAWFDPDGFLLAVRDDGELLGYHWTKVHDRDPSPAPDDTEPGPVGEVYVLGVAPHAHGGGLGSALTRLGLAYLRDRRGLDTVMLYVEGDNAPALRVYERLGFTTHTVDVAYRRP